MEDILSEYNAGCGRTKKEANAQILLFFEDAIKGDKGKPNENHGFLVVNTIKQFGEGRL